MSLLSYYPQRANYGKRDSSNLIKGKDKRFVRHNFKVDTSPPKGQAAQLLGKFPFRSHTCNNYLALESEPLALQLRMWEGRGEDKDTGRHT